MDNSIEITLRIKRTPGGRGRNAVHWEGKTQHQEWFNADLGQNENVVVGKIVMRHLANGEKSVEVKVKYSDN